jgi:ATP citrate (pro-S)-lyase
MSSSYLFTNTTQAIVYNYKPEPVQRMLDFDFICKRKLPSVAALISPGSERGNHKLFFGTKEILIPIYPSTSEASLEHPEASVFINYASHRSAYHSSLDALMQDAIRCIVIIAEGIPEQESRKLLALSKKKNKVIIGPATVGGIQPGAFKIGDAAGTIDNILACKLYRPGSVGFVSKSGGLSNECYNILSKTTDGLFEGIAIGGDSNPGSSFADHLLRFEQIKEIKLLVVLGEIGGDNEYGIVELLKAGQIKKPLICWVSGTCATLFPTEVQFGHAGAKSGASHESAQAKLEALREAGALVPNSFEGFTSLIADTYKSLAAKGVVPPLESVDNSQQPHLPVNYNQAVNEGRVRRSTGIVSTICDDRGEEPTYCGVPVSQLVEEDSNIADALSLLWFKKKLPKFATKYIEMVLILTADHGPCVSGAHNSIIASRAGKDIVSCVCSGLLTIGPRFGGAIDDAARYFKKAVDGGLTPEEFIEDMKKQGIRIPGIGHRIKSAGNRDKRVLLMMKYARHNFPSTRYLNYALEVEKLTLAKAANLVLNVDGCIGALFLDLMESSASFSSDEQNSIVEIGYLNGLFVLGRTIGLIGHTLDQKRLKQPLYRHPWDDVMYWQ